jgi:hypothetical protein
VSVHARARAGAALALRCESVRFIGGTHETDIIAIGIMNDCVSRAPERVVRLLATTAAGSDQVGGAALTHPWNHSWHCGQC